MKEKPTFTKNNYGVKSSSDTYRNINGIHFRHLTSDPSLFEEEKVKAKNNGLRTKIINGELFIEKKEVEV